MTEKNDIDISVFLNLNSKNDIEEFVKRLSWNESLKHMKALNYYLKMDFKEYRTVEIWTKLLEIKLILGNKIVKLRNMKSRVNRNKDTRKYPFKKTTKTGSKKNNKKKSKNTKKKSKKR